MEDAKFIEDLRRGDRAAFGQLIDSFQGRVFNTCLNFVYNAEDAEDLAQEVFLEVFRSIRKFKGESKLSTWIYRISVSKSLEHIRKHKRKKRDGQVFSITALQESGFDPRGSELDHPGVALENKERAKALFAAIAQLPDKQRTAFTLNKVEGRPYQEVADIMELSLSSIESLIFRARKALKKILEDFYKNEM